MYISDIMKYCSCRCEKRARTLRSRISQRSRLRATRRRIPWCSRMRLSQGSSRYKLLLDGSLMAKLLQTKLVLTLPFCSATNTAGINMFLKLGGKVCTFYFGTRFWLGSHWGLGRRRRRSCRLRRGIFGSGTSARGKRAARAWRQSAGVSACVLWPWRASRRSSREVNVPGKGWERWRLPEGINGIMFLDSGECRQDLEILKQFICVFIILIVVIIIIIAVFDFYLLIIKF